MKSMKFTWTKVVKCWVIVLIFIFYFFTGSIVLAEEERVYYAKNGFYMGVTTPYNTINGDFDGETILVASDEIVLVPEIENNYGWGILIGGRDKNGAVELSYLRSTHDASFLGAEGEAVYNMINLDLKGYFLADKPVQPYLLMGLCIPWLVVEDASATAYEVGDVTFKGIGLNLGAGLAYYFHPRVSINGGVTYRWITYTSAEGVSGKNRSIEDELSGNGLSFNVGMAFTF
jgi:hypothetical protein